MTLGLLFLIAFAQFFIKRPHKQSLTTLFISSFVALVGVEGIMVSSGFMSTSLENRGVGRPLDVDYVPSSPIRHGSNIHFSLSTGVYSFDRVVNDYGFADRDWKEKNSAFRIVALGDSFTEGDGTSSDSTWVALLEKKFQKQNINLEIFNAGSCGSDPYEELRQYEMVLSSFNPDMIILATSTLDFVFDCQVLGGTERFDRTGIDLSIGELLYGFSRIARLLFSIHGYNDSLIPTRDVRRIKEESEQHIENVVSLYSKIDSLPVLIIQFPWVDEVSDELYIHSLNNAFKESSSKHPNISYYDILPCYTSMIKTNGFVPEDLWWIPDDAHHKPRGYAMMADCIYDNISADIKMEMLKFEFANKQQVK
jgi:hypothetical protein